MSKATTVTVLALVDWPQHGIKAGTIVTIPKDDVKAMKLNGLADDNEKAVEHYRSEGFPAVDITAAIEDKQPDSKESDKAPQS